MPEISNDPALISRLLQSPPPKDESAKEILTVGDLKKALAEMEKKKKKRFDKRNIIETYKPVVDDLMNKISKKEEKETKDEKSDNKEEDKKWYMSLMEKITGIGEQITTLSKIEDLKKNKAAKEVSKSNNDSIGKIIGNKLKDFGKSILSGIKSAYEKIVPGWARNIISFTKQLSIVIYNVAATITKISWKIFYMTMKFMIKSIVLPVLTTLGSMIVTLGSILATVSPILAIVGLAVILLALIFSPTFRTWMWDNVVSPLWTWITEKLPDILWGAWEVLTTLGSWIADLPWADILWKTLEGFAAIGGWIIGLVKNAFNWFMETPFGQALKSTFEWIGGVFKTAWEGLENVFSWLGNLASDFWGWLEKIPFIGPVFQWLKGTFIDGWNWITDKIKWILNKMGFVEAAESAGAQFEESKAAGKGNIQAASDALGAGVATMLGYIKSPSQLKKEAEENAKSFDQITAARFFSRTSAQLAMILSIMRGDDKAMAISASKGAYFMEKYRSEVPFDQFYNQFSKGITLEDLQNIISPPYKGKQLLADQLYLTTRRNPDDPFVQKNIQNWNDMLSSLKPVLEARGYTADQIGVDQPFNIQGIAQFAASKTAEQENMLPAAAKGMIVRVGEGGDDEAIIPLNEAGIEFMKKTIQAALMKVSVPDLIVGDDGSTLDERFMEINENIKNMGQATIQAIGQMNKQKPASPQPPSLIDPEFELSKMLSRGNLGSRGGNI